MRKASAAWALVFSLSSMGCGARPAAGPAGTDWLPPEARALEAPPPPDPGKREELHQLDALAPAPGIAPFALAGDFAIFNRAPDLIAFSSTRSPEREDFDVFVYDRVQGTVLAVPAVNTGFNEVDPHISANGRWLVYATDANGQGLDVQLADLGLAVIDTLSTLNTGAAEFFPSVDDTGRMIAYTCRVNGVDQLRLYSLVAQRTFIPAALNRFRDMAVEDTTVSSNGRFVAFAAAMPEMGMEIFTYDVETGALLSPPFVNSAGDERMPNMSLDGNEMLFVSNRDGHDDIFVANLVTGVIDRLALANSPADEQEPRFLGPGNEEILFQTNRSGSFKLAIFNRTTGTIDTLPIANAAGSEQLLGDAGVMPEPPATPEGEATPATEAAEPTEGATPEVAAS